MALLSHVFLLAISFCFLGSHATILTLQNNCGVDVWPTIIGASSSGSAPGPVPAPTRTNEGLRLSPSESVDVDVSREGIWEGQIWARTGCSIDQDGNLSCVTGGCDNECQTRGSVPIVTVGEISLYPRADIYDVNVNYGFNVEMAIAPITTSQVDNMSCGVASCRSDINQICPFNLRVISNGNTVACVSPCQSINSECCNTGNFMCDNANYLITFC